MWGLLGAGRPNVCNPQGVGGPSTGRLLKPFLRLSARNGQIQKKKTWAPQRLRILVWNIFGPDCPDPNPDPVWTNFFKFQEEGFFANAFDAQL